MKMLLFTLMLHAGLLMAQAPDIEWQKCFGGSEWDFVTSVDRTSDGGYIVSGHTNSNDGDIKNNHGGIDYWAAKLTGKGSVEWFKCLGGTKDEGYRSFIRQTADGGYIFTGYTQSVDGDVSGLHGVKTDIWIVKLNDAGTIEWQKCLGGTGAEEPFSTGQTNDGGYIIAGFTDSQDGNVNGSHGQHDAWIVKLDNSGTIEWQNCLGGSKREYARSIRQTSDGGYIVAGNTYSTDGDVSNSDENGSCWIMKLSGNGTIEWQKCMGGSADDIACSIMQTNDGGYIIACDSDSEDGDVSGHHGNSGDFTGTDVWMVKLNKNASVEWQKCFGGTNNDIANSIELTNDDGFIITGYTESNDGDVSGNHGNLDIWVFRVNGSGALQWQKCIGGSAKDYGSMIWKTNDNGYIIAGFTHSNDGDVSGKHGNSAPDGWLVKFTTDKSQILPNSVTNSSGQLNLLFDNTGEEIVLHSNAGTIESIVISSITGSSLYHNEYYGETADVVVPVGSLAPGLYFAKVRLTDGTVLSMKFLRE